MAPEGTTGTPATAPDRRDRPGPGGALRLVPLSAASDPRLLAGVLGLGVLPHQQVFTAPAADTFSAAAADRDRTPFAVLAGGRPVGFGVLDRGRELRTFVDDPDRAVLLRAFYIGAGHQGRGHGTAAARAVRSLAAQVAPAAQLVVLGVHERNGTARRAYARAGFVDTGGRLERGSAGTEVVLAATVRPAARPDARRNSSRSDRPGDLLGAAGGPLGDRPEHGGHVLGERQSAFGVQGEQGRGVLG